MYLYEKITYYNPFGGGPADMSLMRMPEDSLITEVEKYDFSEGKWKNNEEWGLPRPDIIDEWHEVVELEERLCSHSTITEEEAERIIEAKMAHND